MYLLELLGACISAVHEAQGTYSSVLIELAVMYIGAFWFCCNVCLCLMVKKGAIIAEGEEGYYSITVL